VTNSPFPVSQKLASRAGSASAIMICMIAGIGFALIPASTVSNIVTEKEKGLKHMQIVSGLSLGSYWVANFIFDVVKTFLPCILTVGVIYMFDMGYEYAWATILMFPLGVVPYSYAISFLFTTESTAQTVVLFSNIIAGSIGGMAVFILRMIPDTMEYGDMISKWLKIIPTYAISNSIIYDGSKTSFNMTRTFGQY
jgi:ATP-binding cassette subfamily A (ABC1) protein 1